jgi:ATP-binding cassette subfamily B protein
LLEVKNVSFAWPDGRQALNDISFTVQPGERVGIFGTIGSGKSTLFNLVTRLYPFTQGKILIKGHDIATMDPAAVRSAVAYGLQQPLLFSESVRSNLCLGLDESQVKLETLERATKQAQVYDDIMRLPDTWDTLIGEKGIKLSGGQKQRLALARLLMRQSQLIILDDVLSAVDHDTEHRLIESLLQTKSALVIASHRVSILEPCDKVLVMQNGKLIAHGPFSKIRSVIDFADTPPDARGDV